VSVGDPYFKRESTGTLYVYVARVPAAPANIRLSVANIGKGQFPSNHRQRNSDYGQRYFRPEIN
jgi:hypothetical protein